jgi:hypothetical protein
MKPENLILNLNDEVQLLIINAALENFDITKWLSNPNQEWIDEEGSFSYFVDEFNNLENQVVEKLKAMGFPVENLGPRIDPESL